MITGEGWCRWVGKGGLLEWNMGVGGVGRMGEVGQAQCLCFYGDG